MSTNPHIGDPIEGLVIDCLAGLKGADETAAAVRARVVEDIIGPGEIRALAGGVTRQTFKRWQDGANLRGAGAFPKPIRTVSGVELYDRRAVIAWLEEHR